MCIPSQQSRWNPLGQCDYQYDWTASSCLKKAQQFSINEDGLLGGVWIGNTRQPTCVPGTSALTTPGRLGKNTKVPSGTPCLVDTAAVNNLLQGISVNCCLAHPKGNVVPVIMINWNNHNVWIWQSLLAEEIFGVEHLPWDYGVELHQEGNKIEVAFQPLPMADIMASVKAVHNKPDKLPLKEEASPTVPMSPKLSLSIKNLGRIVSAWIIGN